MRAFKILAALDTIDLMYWTYGILDPTNGLFVYVGQTNDIERRKRQHSSVHRTKKTDFPPGSIKTWLCDAHRRKIEPVFIILDIAENEEASLISETAWVEKLGRQAGHPLRNLWEEHKDAMEPSGFAADGYNALIFEKGKEPRKIGSARPNAKKSGLRVEIAKGIEINGPVTIDLVAKRASEDD